ncbi:putative membrane protein [Leptospira yanagawae serovar Saopaulo str. Sao Paulo = ATCC 700523]|uniref:Putative membrane protein n=1 Tax=Leptospira yanagawae serovar Saopaulo str. Sao Paulo = ATCC 700523 TaxID=1249483 RepID=A0A5E8HG56_9LEPT|nr:hypothetical protein [Leptospira yanagawae]EOQ90255.1 putative membrane protein [Leptospira yanagawae serovar Saopaulo str. Sao Paulo = ATCC 700523]
MLKNLYILSENSWGIKSSEIFADFFYFISLIGFLGYSLAFVTPIPIIPILLVSLITLVYLGICIRVNQSPYWLGLISQLLLVIIILPTTWFDPILLTLSFILSYALHYFLIQNYSIRTQIVSLVFLVLFILDTAFSLIGYQLRQTYELQSFSGINLETSVFPISIPWVAYDPSQIIRFTSIVESLGIYVLVCVAWVSFRRTILLSFFLLWSLLFFVWGLGSGISGTLWLLSFASMAFFLQLAPGRNFYGSYYVTLLSFVILLPIAFFVGKMGISAIWVVIVFFLVEALFVRVFLGK